MLRLEHFLNPVCSAKVVYRKALAFSYRCLFNHRFNRIRRGQRDHCWCGGELLPFKWHAGFGVCERCGCYVNRRPPLREELEKLYSLEFYWKKRQRSKGYPTIENRAALYLADGRVNFWLDLIEKYGPSGGTVLEVGCSPGILLQQLNQTGYQCVGIEISQDVAEWIRKKSGSDVRCGFFPGVPVSPCNLFLAFDVLEHSPCPEVFIHEMSNSLLPEGVAIIQTPIDRSEYESPFGNRFDVFDDFEHLFLFTNRALEMLAQGAGLSVLSLNERLWPGHEIAVFQKP